MFVMPKIQWCENGTLWNYYVSWSFTSLICFCKRKIIFQKISVWIFNENFRSKYVQTTLLGGKVNTVLWCLPHHLRISTFIFFPPPGFFSRSPSPPPLPRSSCSLSQQVDFELLTGLIQMWWHALARGIKLRIDSPPPFFPFPPAYLSITTTPLFSSASPVVFLCLCHFPLGGVSHCLLYSSYTNWG